MSYQQIFHMSNTVGSANRTGTASPSEVELLPLPRYLVFTPRVDQSLPFCVILCEQLSFCYFCLFGKCLVCRSFRFTSFDYLLLWYRQLILNVSYSSEKYQIYIKWSYA